MLHDLQYLIGTSIAVLVVPFAERPNERMVTQSLDGGPMARGSSSAGVFGCGCRLRGRICASQHYIEAILALRTYTRIRERGMEIRRYTDEEKVRKQNGYRW